MTLIVGVNGTGKTTTIGKLANLLKASGKDPLVCAADTFRAAAVEQLEIWAEARQCRHRPRQGRRRSGGAWCSTRFSRARRAAGIRSSSIRPDACTRAST